MFIRQLFDPDTSTYTYLLADAARREAVLIDPVRGQVDRDEQILNELGLRLLYTLETHVHADHVTGAYLLKQRLGSQIAMGSKSGAEADVLLEHGQGVRFGAFVVEARHTPGHTNGCVTYVTGDLSMAFTGDALLIRGAGRTDFQQGDARLLYRVVWDEILSLPDDTILYPGHDYQGRTSSTVREEKAFNPRLGMNKTVDEFVDIMDKLGLAYPRHIDVAMPANLNLGRLEGDPEIPVVDDAWDDVVRSPSGTPIVSVDWVAQNRDQYRIIDVRQPDEFAGPSGHLKGAELVPLGILEAKSVAWNRDLPLVLICQSSGRSDRAALALERLGFHKVASMTGGMMAWGHADGLA